jgi:hypothetical protein
MSKFLNNKDRHTRAEFDKLLARCVRVVEAQPNLATLRLCESVCVSLTTLLESIRLTIEDRPRKNDLVMLRDRIQELSFERANESLNTPKYQFVDEDDVTSMAKEQLADLEWLDNHREDETQIFGSPGSDGDAYWAAKTTGAGDILLTDIGTEAPDFPIDQLRDNLRAVVARLRDASTKGDVSPYTLATLAGQIDTAVSEFDKEVGS